MKISPALCTSFILLLIISAGAQSDIYIPLNIKAAYERQTRSFDGSPGKNYWQNSSVYKIKVNVDPAEKLITGREEIEYSNNSPDSLTEIVIRLYQNIFKPGAGRDFTMKDEDLTKGVQIAKFDFNGRETVIEGNPNVSIEGTNLIYKPDKPVMPGSKFNMEFEWDFNLSSRHLRMGVYDSTSFFIAYWYPQVSVYDDIDGWDKNDYTGQYEFYNDFNSYDVEVTLPNTFAVWATGILQNPEDLFTDEYLKRYNLAHQSEEVVKIVAPDDLMKNIYSSRNGRNTWRFKAENVPDFSFALSDHYLWDALSINAGKNSSLKVFISAAYKKESADFYHVAEISKRSVKYFADVLPGIPFPFPVLTIFNGGASGGMEFPMMVNDASFVSKFSTVGTTSHEIAHQYLPFFVGTNERKYAFMDEGMAVMLPFDFQESEIEGNFPKARYVYQYELLAGREMDMPPATPSVLLRRINYRTAVYTRPGLAYHFLRDALSTEVFDKALREYINRWNGKHPTPYDFFYTFNEMIGENLNWFWIPWFFEKGYPDLAVKDVKQETNKLKIVIEKAGNIPIPIIITLINEDNSEVTISKTAAVWKNGETEILIEHNLESKKVKYVRLGSPSIPDAVRDNNEFILNK